MSGERLGQNRKYSPQEYRKSRAQEKQVIQNESALPRKYRIELVLGFEVPHPVEEHGERKKKYKSYEPQEKRPYIALCERVNGRYYAAPRYESTEYGEEKGYYQENHVPFFEHPLLFLDHDGVKESRACEPWH